MASNYTANQYEGAYKLGNMRIWQTGQGQLRKDPAAKRPDFQPGVTVPFCDLNGRFVDAKYRAPKATAYPNFVHTWYLPRRLDIHPKMLNSTARSPKAAAALKAAHQQGLEAVNPPMEQRMRQGMQNEQECVKKKLRIQNLPCVINT